MYSPAQVTRPHPCISVCLRIACVRVCVCVRGRESSDRQPRASRLAQAAGLGTLYKADWKLENITLAWYFAEGETACL